MFNKIVDVLKAVFYGRTLKDTYEDILVQEAAKGAKIEEPVETTIVINTKEITEDVVLAPEIASIHAEPTHGAHSAVTDQITDAVTTKPKRARGPKGRLKADDKSTPDVNEAWVGGKAPAKAAPKPKKQRNKKNK